MFTIDTKIDEKDLKRKNIYKVLLSMNSHQVATPETSLEEARSYVFIFREGKNRLSAYIGLHLLLTDRKLMYKHSANPFLEEELSDVEDEARDFAEYMGAMMDEVDFEGMSDLEQESWIENQGIFSTRTQTEPVPAEQPPVPDVAEETPAERQPASPEQPSPTEIAISEPAPAAAPVQPLPKAYHAEAQEKQREAPVMEKVQQDVQDESPPPAVTKRQEIEQKESKTVIETPPKPKTRKISYSVTSVVSRDREALARLLTSF